MILKVTLESDRVWERRVSMVGGKKEEKRVWQGLAGINFTIPPKLILASLNSQE